MEKQQGFTMIELIIVIVALIGFIMWAVNAAKLASCDFELPLRCEVIHGAGLVMPPLSLATVWFDDDGQQP